MFSLIEEPWILAHDDSGQTVELSLRDVFSGTHRVVNICGDSPLQDYAITRLLLAIFWSAHKEEYLADWEGSDGFEGWFANTWEQVVEAGTDQHALDYLESYADRFFLLDPVQPFMQVADLHVKDGSHKPINAMVPEFQDSYFSMRAGKAVESLTLQEAARWLVYTQAFDYSGIKSGAVGDEKRVKNGKGYPIGQGWTGLTGGTLVKGRSLLETLVLNTTESCLEKVTDKPVWERKPDGPEQREDNNPQGPNDLATWQSRRMRLFAEDDLVTGVLICNGDKIPDAGANVFGDPMTPYRWSKNKSSKTNHVYYPRPYDLDRTMWRSLDALIVTETDGGFGANHKSPKRPQNLDRLARLSGDLSEVPKVLDVDLFSLEYGPKASSVATTIKVGLGIPTKLLLESNSGLRDQVRAAADKANDVARELGFFGGNLSVAAGGDYEFAASLTDRFLALLEPEFLGWIRELADVDDAQPEAVRSHDERWERTVRDLAEQLAKVHLRGAGPKAFTGRIVKQSAEDTRGRVVSAGSIYSQLVHKLNTVLVSTKPPVDADSEKQQVVKEDEK